MSLLVKNLHAVMYIADDGTIRTYHASFADSILRLPVSMDSALTADILCDVEWREACLALQCYHILKEKLHFNMCSLESSFALDKDLPDLQRRVEAKVDPTLQYAVLYWCVHLEASRPSKSQAETNTDSSMLREIPQAFVDSLLLFWLEVINLTGNKTAALRRFSSERLHHWIGKVRIFLIIQGKPAHIFPACCSRTQCLERSNQILFSILKWKFFRFNTPLISFHTCNMESRFPYI